LHQRRIAALQNLRTRWIAEYPAILAADPVRARHHAEALADLEHLIGALKGKPITPAVFEIM
jgi:hypothetical protein